jgi:integrase
MASIRVRKRADGSTAYNVVYIYDKRQTSVTFDTQPDAEQFLSSVQLLGADRAMKAFGIAPTARAAASMSGVTVAGWVATYIASRTGVAKSTLYDYKAILRNDITPALGAIPLEMLGRDDVVGWVQGMSGSGKTIANKHGLLSAALNAAVRADLIPANPAVGVRMPRSEKPEMVFLTRDEFTALLAGFMERWRPMIEFLVLSGVRFGELSALKPSDVDLAAGTVRISRARKRTYEKGANYQIGPTKTVRSVRTINVTPTVLEKLDHTGEWLFTNTRGGPVKLSSWRTNVWYPSVARAQAAGLKKQPRVHDLRHTCASWMIAKGVSLPVIQRHLGHESISTSVNLYGHLDRSQSASAAALIGDDLYGTPEVDASPEAGPPSSPPQSE